MKYQVLFEHPCLQMKRYFCSTLMLSAWWENRTDQPSMSFHYVTAGRTFLGCNTPISLFRCAKVRNPLAVAKKTLLSQVAF